MAGHVRALAVLQVVYASLGLLLAVMLFILFGGIAAIVGATAPIEDSRVAVPVLTLVGGFVATMLILLSLPRLIAGIGLYKYRNWGRILTLVVSVLGLVDIPVGAGLGIYGLWVLTRPDSIALFEPMPAPPQRA
jgi:hypothetical protein